ncbi:acyl-CoA dehydrogenase [Mycobacterium avium subsp. avium 11-4751]|nr:acyl-CoA dehydrogenase [Mycobacterium avium subsp. avium 11-4751]
MDLEYTPEQQQLRAEIRVTLQTVMTPERVAAVSEQMDGGPAVRECVRALAAANLLGVGWPKEYGGRGFSAIEQFIFAEEARRVSAPIPLVTLNTVGPTLMHYGTDEQKRRFLPAILDGTVEFAIGYSEPGAGSDLASVHTTAVRVGDEYVINGQKMFTSGAAYADYIWLAVRTDPDAKKHKGISILIVPTSSPGFSWQPLHTMPGISTFYTFYDDVRVPVSALVGAENQGWQLITTQLNFERAALGNLGALEPLFDKTLDWALSTELDGGRVIDQPWVRSALARVEAQVAAYKLVNLRVNAAMTKGALNMGEASAAKVFGTELTQQVARELLEVLDGNGVRRGAEAPLRGALESAYRQAVINTFGGGANEIQRDIIAMAALGMPAHRATFGPRNSKEDRTAVTDSETVSAKVRALVGQPTGGTGKPSLAPDPVNQPMIRHWAYAMADMNPVYLDPEFAASSRFGGIVSPPVMLQTWTMPSPKLEGIGERGGAPVEIDSNPTAFLDEAGYTSTVATNSEFEIERYPRLGDVISATTVYESVSDEKKTALGTGFFLTWLTTYTDQNGEVLGRQRFRVLRFRPAG